jgi:undecaprenyl-diphosphatase
MVWWTAVFLGLMQGIAEFLPISSSGHLLMFEHWFGIADGGLLFDIILHIATLLAVCAVYHKRIWALIRRPFCKYNAMLLAATAITCAFVLVFKGIIDRAFDYRFLPFAFIATAVVLLLPAVVKPKTNKATGGTSSGGAAGTSGGGWCAAAAMGLAQGLAVVPGLSRSGFTITAGQLSGGKKTDSADFSFLMSVPIIAASLLYEIISGGTVISVGAANIIIAFVSAFISGIVAIKFMLSVIRKIDLRWFSIYLFVLGTALMFNIYGGLPW